MTPTEIREIRTALGLTQAQMGNLINAHPVTVSRWENGRDDPSSYQKALLQSFQKASECDQIDGQVAEVLLSFVLYRPRDRAMADFLSLH